MISLLFEDGIIGQTSVLEVFNYAYAQRALLASVMVGIMCGMLGCFIILRNMALIGDALSHAILPGVVVGFMIAGHNILGFFTGSVLAGLIAAILITWIQRNAKTQEDAAIGIVFTAMFAIGVIGISWLTQQEGVHLDLKDFLFGNVLGISNEDLWMTFLVMLYTLICIAAFYRYFFMTTFESVVSQTLGVPVGSLHYFLMLLLSFSVVASLQSVGVILVVAMLITPASTAYLLSNRLHHMLIIAAVVGIISTSLGLLLAIIFQTTPGPAMTITATVMYTLALFFAPQKGLLSKYLKRRIKQAKFLADDILKESLRLQEKNKLNPQSLLELQAKIGASTQRFRRSFHQLKRKGYFIANKESLQLSPEGIQRGKDLLRAHRLWESYLVEKMGLDQTQIHRDAEKYEHILPAQLVDDIDQSLGFPDVDPHGSPIPKDSRD